MSEAVQHRLSTHGRWFAGIPFLALAVALAVAEGTIPQLTSGMSVTGRVLFRSVYVLFAMIGLAQLLAAWSPTRGTLATPSFGKHRLILPVEGIVYLAIMFVLFTGAMLTKSNMLLLVFALMAGPFVINGWMTFGMLQSARVSRTAPERAMVGELFGVEMTLSNSRPVMSIWIMTVRDEIRHSLESLTATVLFARVSPRSSQAGHYQLRLMRRGRYQLGPILTSSRFPLGLVERSRLFPISGEILVYPRIGRLAPSWRRRWLGATELVARPQPRSGIFHDEFHRLREFRTGDNPRDIHWRSSARRGELILREYQQNRDFNLAVVVDLWIPASRESAAVERAEKALSFAATVIVEHSRVCRDAILSFSVSGTSTFRWQGQGTTASLESLFDGLAMIEAGSAVETIALLDETLHQTTSSTQIVLLTTRPAELASAEFNIRNSRIDLVRLAEIDFDSTLYFDDVELQPSNPDSPKDEAKQPIDKSQGVQ